MTRLDKYLANAGAGTRTTVKDILKAGRVKVNGVVVKDGASKITDTDVVVLDNTVITFEKYRYYMLNKPAGCVSATKDRLSDTVLDFFKGEDMKDFFPVGRLDKDTEGLLLITNDGELAHNLLSPKKHVEKTYFVTVDKKITNEAKRKIENCIDIGDDKPCLPAKVETIDDNNCFIVISEGRFHQVKRMFASAGYEVVYLKRVKMGTLELDEELEKGCFRKLDGKEINELKGDKEYGKRNETEV